MNSGKHPWGGAAVMVAATGLLAGLSVWGTVSEGGTRERLVLDIAVAVVGCAASPVLLRRPVGGALGLSVLAALSPAATPAATAGALQVAQSRPFPAAVAVAAAGVAAHAAQGLWRLNSGISLGWWLVLIVVAYAAARRLGRPRPGAPRAHRLAARARAAAEAEQGRRVAEARMLERTRMAREMHDVLAHRLSLLATYAGALEYRPDAPPERLAHAAGVVRTGVHQALEELREVIGVLRDEERDFGDRPQPVLADVPRLVEESRDAGAAVTLRDGVAEAASLPPAAGRAAYRVVQEGLTNARKHAAGLPVQVTLEGRPGTDLEIDLRNPLPPDGAPPLTAGSGTGLVGLTERVRLAGGLLDHETAGGEFRLRARLPWPA
ncbi:sensor histidine kinase [Actinomadura sp. CNU-125]|uniref:sensor histidine kinase n=1 Tax=Actinomadura sp. CNU-125 TaxID=1904961 RepID=UPI0021CC9EB6|nr:histidine kinase [Actinomadura sp. CNU-125]